MIFELVVALSLFIQTQATVIFNQPTELISPVPSEPTQSATPIPALPTPIPTVLSASTIATLSPEPTSSPTQTPTNSPKPTITPTASLHSTASPSSSPTLEPKITPTTSPTQTPTPTQSSPTTYTISGPELDALFTKYADQYKVDREQLRRIALCESKFNTNALNKKYEYGGLYQFAPLTWKAYRKLLGQDQDPNLRFNPEESVETAAWMLATGRAGAWPNCK